LKRRHGLTPDEVESVVVSASKGANDTLVYEGPTTQTEAKFSMHYTVASALLHDRVGFEAFKEETINGPTIQEFCDRVDFVVDPSLDYDTSEATVRVETMDGNAFESSVVHPPGSPANPISAERMREKFLEGATRATTESVAERAYERFSSFADGRRVVDALYVIR
jgi:2-methylcitrate dehydratase PrpD